MTELQEWERKLRKVLENKEYMRQYNGRRRRRWFSGQNNSKWQKIYLTFVQHFNVASWEKRQSLTEVKFVPIKFITQGSFFYRNIFFVNYSKWNSAQNIWRCLHRKNKQKNNLQWKLIRFKWKKFDSEENFRHSFNIAEYNKKRNSSMIE